MKFTSYNPGGYYDEMFDLHARPRASAILLIQTIQSLPDGELKKRQQAAEAVLLDKGVTFGVYGDEVGIERSLPFDSIPRLIEMSEWGRIEQGLRQRVMALNLFVDDIYHSQKIIKDGAVPARRHRLRL